MPIILTKNFDGQISEEFASSVRERAASGSKSGIYDFVYIVPTRRRVRELARELVDGITFGKLPAFTMELFAHELYSLLKIGRRMISPSMQGMIVSEILSRHSRDGFKFFRYTSRGESRQGSRKGVAPVGTIKKIVDQIDYLKENGITPQDYQLMSLGAGEFEKQKLEEFLEIYSDYENKLGKSLIDSTGVLSLVNSELVQSSHILEENYPGKRTFFVEGFYNFKKPELEFLRILSSCRRFSFVVKLDCGYENENLFKTMLATSAELADRGFKIQKTKSKPEVDRKAGLRSYFESCLFAERELNTKFDLAGKVFVVSVPDKLREVEFVAEKIKEIVDKNPGQKLDRICVASYLPQSYSQIVREVFAKYQIPANITDRYTLESNGAVNAVLSFIDIKLTGCERGALLRALTNRILSVSEEMSASEAGSVVYRAAALCRFERGLKKFKDAIETRVELLEKLGREDPDENGIQIRHDVDALKKTRRLLDSIENKLAAFPDSSREGLSPDEFRGAVKSLVYGLGVYENIARLNIQRVSTEVVERDARALSAFFEVLDEVAEVESESENRKLDLGVWIENLRSALSLTRYNLRQKHGYGVYVTALEEIRGLEFDYMFIIGLNEGELPTRYVPEIFIPLLLQKENRETQPYLQRHLFYQAVSSFRKNLFLVSPAQTNDVHLIRSSFVDAFLDVADASLVDEISVGGIGEGLKNICNLQQLIELDTIPHFHEKISSNGAERFLPANTERCKVAESARYRGNRDSEFHGKLSERELIGSIAGSFEKKIFSAAQIESLARCGFQYFARRILQIAEIPDIETSLSAIERGAVLHKILFQFYNGLSNTNRLDNTEEELELLVNVGKQVLDELGIEHDLFEVEKETILGTADVPGTLELFLTKMQTRLSEFGFRPLKFEIGFGMKSGDGSEDIAPVRIGDIGLRGKVDRIDSHSNGLMIFDYKTSSVIPAHKDVVDDKISPQLLLYLNALDQVVRAGEVDVSPPQFSGAAFISISRDRLLRADQGKSPIQFVVQSEQESGELRYNPSFGSTKKLGGTEKYPKTMDELLKGTELFVNEKVTEARSGRFNLTRFSREKVCRYCSYSEACRIALTGESFAVEESA